MRSLQSGDQDEAIQSFRNYLHDNGASPYADDAQFWIGEAYFRKGQYHRAIIEFNSVSTNYGSGDRAPSALLRQAEAFRIVGDRVDARLSLQKVINRYPGTSEASKASKMLTEIGG
jgi:tol-pal system protein YbgF